MLAQKLRDMHAMAADSCDPEFNKVLIEAAAEIERLQDAKRAALAVADERSKENVALLAALKEAPRPIPGSLAKWQITYSDWFRVRDAALEQGRAD